MRRWFIAPATAALLLVLTGAAVAATIVTTPNGTWRAYPGQATAYAATIQQPINGDKTSNWSSKSKGAIPIMFKLSTGQGPFLFHSIFSDTATSNDYSFLDWQSATPLTFADLIELSAVYAFTDGDCAGGSLRWTVTLNDAGTYRNLDIHYQPGVGGISQQMCAANTSGANLLQSSDAIYVTQEFNATHPGAFSSSYNNTYAEAVAELGDLPVVDVALIVDSGWGANGDQVVDLTSATVATDTYSETFVPQAATPLAPTCDLPAASLKVSRLSPAPTGAINESTVQQSFDDGNLFRVVDCKYQYNLSIPSSLGGQAGQYKIEIQIPPNGPSVGEAYFDLR
jgi:hypothetical protein